MRSEKVPNLFIIGSMKSGTTSLHDCLGLHPEIFMASFKEPQYFAPHEIPLNGMWGEGHDLPERGIDWYLRLFADAGDACYAGESSTAYTRAPHTTGCAERIHAFNPDARLLFIMRDPVERTISHYWHMVAYGSETRPMLEAIEREEIYMSVSHYARQLEPYLQLFGSESIYCLTLEELRRQPIEILDGLLGWLGVERCADQLSFEQHNVRSRLLSQTKRGFEFYHKLRFHWRWKQLESRCPQLSSIFHRICKRTVDPEAVDLAPVRSYLREIQQPQVLELSKLLDREFPEWTTLWDSRNAAVEAGVESRS